MNLLRTILSYCVLLMGLIPTDALAGRYVEDNPEELELMGPEYTWLIGLSLLVLILCVPSLVAFLKNRKN